MEQKYYVRAKPNLNFISPGAWTEVTHAQYEVVRKAVKATSSNFVKGGIEGLVVTIGSSEAYQYLYPELYTILMEAST